jgi:N-acetylglutamate synthase/N-acetylornithine aminotransferase
MTASGHKQTGHHDMGQVRFTPECVAKTIFTTRTSNIDSRTSTSAQRRFKNTVHLDSIIARSQRSKEFCNTIWGEAVMLTSHSK